MKRTAPMIKHKRKVLFLIRHGHILSLSSVCSNSFVLRSVMFLLAIKESDVALCHAGSFGCELTRLCL